MSSRTVTRRKREVRKHRLSEFPYSEKDVKLAAMELGEPDWLAERRLKAWEYSRTLPMPTLKDEPWRRTDIRTLPADRLSIRQVENGTVDAALLRPLAGDAHGSLLVVQPGQPPLVEMTQEHSEQGVVFADWATAVKEQEALLRTFIGQMVADDEGKFSALAASLARDGVLLYVPKGVDVKMPLHSVFWPAGAEAGFFSRLLVVVDNGASVTYVHEAASPSEGEGEAMHAGIVEIYVGEGANLTFVEVQNLGKHVWNFTHERARVEKDGRLDWIFGGVGSHLTKNFTEIDLIGQGAEGRMSGFYFADGVQHLDHDTQQNHMAPNTTSDLLFKGALVGRSRSVWQGMIYVAQDAQNTDGYQANRNLVLSKDARADSIPGLEILADDVRCTHGATIGQLEEEPIFYLMSRGLTRPQAERLMIDGFFAPIMERIPFEGVRERFKGMIDSKLSTLSSGI
ncbi:MAG: Fe-S cluster assembly protein SufD [Anaerolineales bacterium]|nr:Fe-S cluster assembly protein SufD [Anaerolineales bacterium]